MRDVDVDFPALLAQVCAGGLEAIAEEMGGTREEHNAFYAQFTHLQLSALFEAHLWRQFPFIHAGHGSWLQGRVRDRQLATACQAAGNTRCRLGFSVNGCPLGGPSMSAIRAAVVPCSSGAPRLDRARVRPAASTTMEVAMPDLPPNPDDPDVSRSSLTRRA